MKICIYYCFFFSYGPSIYAFAVPLTSDEISDMLDLHNTYRAGVTSRYMFKLYWDPELAKLAQTRANMCFFEHDLAANRLSPQYGWKNGQNMAMSSEIRSSPASLFDDMLGAEQQNFRYGQPCDPDGTCLHYTQAMLSNITRVGCGQSHCVFPDRIERYVVCNYIQSQYTDNYQTPYVPSKFEFFMIIKLNCFCIQGSTPAIDCPKYAQNGLCDCGNIICNFTNGQYIDPHTCTCKTSSVGKRSIEKRDVNSVGTNNFQSIKKPKLNHISHHKLSKRAIKNKHIKPPYQHAGKRNVPKRHKNGHTE
jgi:hypothetical protein